MKQGSMEDMSGKELLLIGTVHRDPEGAAKLRALLTTKRPLTVAVEVSPYSLYYRRKYGRRLRRRFNRRVTRLARVLQVSGPISGQIQAVRAQLLEPFEYGTARRYCRDYDATLTCLDPSRSSKHWIHSQWQELLSPDNVATLLRQSPDNLEEEVQLSYRLAARLLSDYGRSLVPAFTRAWLTDGLWKEREAELAGRLHDLYVRLQTGLLAYVGGWYHLLSGGRGETLYERLAHLQPRRVLLQGPLGTG